MKKLLLTTICIFFLTPLFTYAAVINKSAGDRLTNGLVGYWTFDGNDMLSNVADRSKQGNHGSMLGFGATSTAVKVGKIGQALDFSQGSTDRISLPSSMPSSNTFTISVWVNPKNSPNSFNAIIAQNNSRGFFFRGSGAGGNAYKLDYFDGTDKHSTSAITSDGWSHVVVTSNAGNATFYINGVNDGTATGLNTAQFLLIGADFATDNVEDCDCYLDDLRVYNRVITAAEITALYNQGKEAGKINTTVPVKKTTNGLVGWWTFDGPDMLTNVKDKSGQNNNGSMINFAATSTVIKPGKIGQGLNFDGVNDYVSIPVFSTLNGASQATLSFWCYRKAGGICTTGYGASSGRFGILWFTDNVIYVNAENGVASFPNVSNTSNNQWVHLTLAYNGSETGIARTKLYVNGVLQILSAGGADPAATLNTNPVNFAFSIGRLDSSGFYYTNSLMDDVRLYNRALSATEVTALYNQGLALTANASEATRQKTALSGLWTMNGPDLTTTTATDKAGVNNGTLNNFPTPLRLAAGKTGQALIFDGVDDNISLGDTNESGTITLAAWVKPSEQKTGMKIVSKKMSGASSQYGLATHGSSADKFTAVFFSSAPSSDVCDSTGTPGSYAANKWVFVAATYDGDTCKMYVNGADVTTVSSDVASGNILNTSSALRIGADGGASIAAGSYFRGAIDDVRIYSTALTAAQIYTLYNLGR